MKFEIDDMVWCRQYGYGDVIAFYDGTNFPVTVQFSGDKVRKYSVTGIPYLTSDDRIIHARERWKEEVKYSLWCLASFILGMLTASAQPW